MLYDLTAVKANIRNREGKRVFFLAKGDQLTSEARDHLTRSGSRSARQSLQRSKPIGC